MIFDDGLAFGLAGREGPALSERLQNEIPRPHVLAFSRWVCIRSRFTEDLVEQAVARDVEQYVILGAGLDSFAYRRGDLLDGLRVFEVDHPASQRWKLRRLSELGVKIPDSLVFTPVDFEHQTLREGLEDAGFAFRRSAVFSWIGVTMYLTLDAPSRPRWRRSPNVCRAPKSCSPTTSPAVCSMTYPSRSPAPSPRSPQRWANRS
jgi:methyltransferase (TIGR00027 family)